MFEMAQKFACKPKLCMIVKEKIDTDMKYSVKQVLS